MESWRTVWRQLAPMLSTPGLIALREALKKDDCRLMQGATTDPAPLSCMQDLPAKAACLIGFCGWQGDGLKLVGEVEEFFTQTCCELDQQCGLPLACRWLLNWFDETPREEMIRELLPEVTLALEDR